MNETSPKSVNIAALVSIVISVMLIVLAVVMFFYYRNLNHDLAVLSDVGKIRNALELHNVINTHYPIEDEAVLLNRVYPGTQRLCRNGFTSYLEPCEEVLLDVLPQAFPEEPYQYQSTEGGKDYLLEFSLLRNHPWLSLHKGVQCATRQGIRPGSCFVQ